MVIYEYISIYECPILDIEHYLTIFQHWSFINSLSELVRT